MELILEWKKYFKEGDVVLIEYWYNSMITPVKILSRIKNKYLICHNIPDSKIQNAPNELIKKTDIISVFRKGSHHTS